jgi:16S rRNA (adenine1518-N6/adenine1519-N6)-dimethyltransferase
MVRPKKHLGQHFLTDPSIAERIVSLLPEDKDKVVMEIGPGTGILTDKLLKTEMTRFIPVEIDEESVVYLVNKYPILKNSIVHEDFLRMDDSYFSEGPLHIIGNFPYNISSQIFFRILEQRRNVRSVICMLQKEVADRIVASPGSKTYGILSVLLQAFYTAKLKFNVKPGSFFPPPSVTSSVIMLTRNNTIQLDCNESLFFRIVKTTFNQRRKTIRNSLKTILLTLGDENELLQKRPEQLSVAEFVALTNFVESTM